LKGNLDTEKAKQAVEHSLTKYCGVNYMISKICKISYVVNVNGEDTATGFASFIDPQD